MFVVRLRGDGREETDRTLRRPCRPAALAQPVDARGAGRRRAASRLRRRPPRRAEDDWKDGKFHTVELFHKTGRCHILPAMAVDPELLEILACPNCKTPVTLVKNGTALKCANVQAGVSDQGRHPGHAHRRGHDRGIEDPCASLVLGPSSFVRALSFVRAWSFVPSPSQSGSAPSRKGPGTKDQGREGPRTDQGPRTKDQGRSMFIVLGNVECPITQCEFSSFASARSATSCSRRPPYAGCANGSPALVSPISSNRRRRRSSPGIRSSTR